jgi:hypothetical protein
MSARKPRLVVGPTPMTPRGKSQSTDRAGGEPGMTNWFREWSSAPTAWIRREAGVDHGRRRRGCQPRPEHLRAEVDVGRQSIPFQTRSRLKAAGGQFRNEVVTGNGGQQILLEDPSGNPVELFQPA